MKGLLFIIALYLFLPGLFAEVKIIKGELTGKDVSKYNTTRIDGILITELNNHGVAICEPEKNFEYALDALFEYKDNKIISQLETQVLESKILYDNMEFDKAIDKLKKGISLFFDNLLLIEQNDALLKAKKMLALSYLAKNNEEDAINVLLWILRIDPDYNLSTSDVSPKIVERFTNLKNELKRVKLTIETNNPALLYIDGKFIEKREDGLFKLSLISGEHHLKLSSRGFVSHLENFTINEERQITIKLNRIDLNSILKYKDDRTFSRIDSILFDSIRKKEDSSFILNSILLRRANKYFIKAELINLPTVKSTLINEVEIGRDLVSPNGKINDFVKTIAGSLQSQ